MTDGLCNCNNDVEKSGSGCLYATASVLVFPCSGGSNVGQITNEAALDLDRTHQARIYCLAGVAAHIPGMVDSAKSASTVIAIDGCPVACARIALEHAGIRVDQSIIVTNLGIEKKHAFIWDMDDVEKVIAAVAPVAASVAAETV